MLKAVHVNRWLWTTVGIVAVALITGCSSQDSEVSFPTPSSETTTSTTDDGSPDSVESPTTTSSEPAEDNDGFTPVTVWFDPNEPIDDDQLSKYVFDAVEAETHNIFWCWANPATCDLELHIGPSSTDDRLRTLQGTFDRAFPDAVGEYVRSDEDLVYSVDVTPINNQEFDIASGEFRFIGIAVSCEVFRGTFVYPDSEDVKMDIGQVTEYRIWQEAEGAVLVSERAVDQQGGGEECDQYLET